MHNLSFQPIILPGNQAYNKIVYIYDVSLLIVVYVMYVFMYVYVMEVWRCVHAFTLYVYMDLWIRVHVCFYM
jgi:hypothetical protein